MPRGFASMTPERVREIASKGGSSVAPENRTFSRYPLIARDAGKKGGQNIPAEKRTFSRDHAAAAEAGRKGAAVRHGKAAV